MGLKLNTKAKTLEFPNQKRLEQEERRERNR